MEKFANKLQAERVDAFRETATSMNLDWQIIEKDFWVVWVMKQLFSLKEPQVNFLFKGGTSLSKVYGVIHRFSEDIDLSINPHDLGFDGENDPRQEGLSKNRRTKLIKALTKATEQLIGTSIKDALEKTIDSKLSEHYSLEVDAKDPQTLLFSYPQSLTGRAYESNYVQPKVRLEFGSRSKHHPTQICTINPYIADVFPDFLNDPNVSVKVLLAERTFWEKAIILHKLFHQFPTKDLPTRMSRHYYDFACIVASPIFEKAMKSIDLLSDDVANCKIFFRSATAKYETAIPGSIRLKPHEALEQALRDDYEKMKIMIIGEPLSFDTIISRIEFVENRVNG